MRLNVPRYLRFRLLVEAELQMAKESPDAVENKASKEVRESPAEASKLKERIEPTTSEFAGAFSRASRDSQSKEQEMKTGIEDVNQSFVLLFRYRGRNFPDRMVLSANKYDRSALLHALSIMMRQVESL